MPPELRLLRYFVAVAEELNFTHAAIRLLIAQPSLSAAIRQLERQLGVVLFERDNRHVGLTPAGEALLPHAREALAAAEHGVRAAVAAADGGLDVLRVLYTQQLAPVALDALDRLEAREPPVPVTAHGVWAGELVRNLREGRADVGVVRFPTDSDDLKARALRGEPVCALVSEHSPQVAERRAVSMAEVADLPVLTFAPELGLPQHNAFVLGLCEAAGVATDTLEVRRLDDSGWLRVVDGRAFALMGATERAPGGTVKLALTDPPLMPLLLTWGPGSSQALVDVLGEAVQLSLDTLAESMAVAGRA